MPSLVHAASPLPAAETLASAGAAAAKLLEEARCGVLGSIRVGFRV